MKPSTTTKIKKSKKINPGDVIAVGDIHARYDVFLEFMNWVKGSGAVVILLGDLIDRGEEDIKVLNAVKKAMDDPASWGLESFYVLMGNHEKMFIDAVEAGGSSTVVWYKNGGNLSEFEAMKAHFNWIRDLPIYMTVGDSMFIHGGVYPGQNPAKAIMDRQADNLLWMRGSFLKYGPELDRWSHKLKRVVHGHTITDRPEIKDQRVAIDTEAFFSGKLTAYNATRGKFWQSNCPYDARWD